MRRLLIAGGVLGALALVPMVRLADLTPDEITNGIDEVRARQGRSRLDALARTHGRHALVAHDRLELELADTWHGPVGSVANPFARPTQRMDARLATRAWTAEFVLTDGPDRGTAWGMTDLAIYRRAAGGEVESPPAVDLDAFIGAEFLIPTLRYFLVLPVEIANAEIVAELDPITEGDRTFDRVYATWGAVEAHAADDQYILWIDRATGRLDRVEYTVREMMRSARGLARYDGYLEVDDVLVPRDIRLFAVLPGGGEARLHVLHVDAARFAAPD